MFWVNNWNAMPNKVDIFLWNYNFEKYFVVLHVFLFIRRRKQNENKRRNFKINYFKKVWSHPHIWISIFFPYLLSLSLAYKLVFLENSSKIFTTTTTRFFGSLILNCLFYFRFRIFLQLDFYIFHIFKFFYYKIVYLN